MIYELTDSVVIEDLFQEPGCKLFFSRFPNNVLFTSASGELWKMVRIGGQPLGFGELTVYKCEQTQQK